MTLIVVGDQGDAFLELSLGKEVPDSPLHVVDMEPDLFTIHDVQFHRAKIRTARVFLWAFCRHVQGSS